ncbi:MAG: hybrid sensor histidine kinase/response regulator [Puniceicoccaceae bacterium]|nr:MAG: hybrid sensor histidine kinase/response regulator [Puniceicoccaceae bacterium]
MPTTDPKKIEILLFEDNGVAATQITKHLDLSKLDFNISIATRLADGIEQLKTRRFDLALLNLNLPDSRDIDTLHTVMKASQGEAIIVLTDTDDEILSLKALKLGAQDSLNKHRINSEAMHRSILHAIERSNLLRSHEARIEGLQCDATILRDITNQKKAEDELFKSEKLESISLLAGGIAHDLNNMLTAILGNISILRIELGESHQHSAKLVAAEKASLQARLLTQQLLTFSKGGAPALEVTTISEMVEECAQFILRGSKVKCSIEKDDDLWPIDADKGQVSQVVNNLIINANQAMPDGGDIRIRMRNLQVRHAEVPALKLGDYICIEVGDEGIGISPHNLKKIFDPYFTTKTKGNGLGLASSYSIIKMHRGTITADSSIGKGSIFKVYLPKSMQIAPAANPFEAEKEEPASEGIHRGKGRILVMDDMEAMMVVAGEILTVLGYDVEYSTNGNEAIKSYKTAKDAGDPFDACVFDLTVPGGMGGEEAANILIDYDPNLVAIASSGYTTSDVMSDYKNSAFKAVLPKPYRIKEMSDVLHELLNS